jgi:flagella basal body P-ring formation protein FlgA
MRPILSLMLVAAGLPGACVQVSSDRIVVRDLVDAVPLLHQLDPDTPVGFAPLPGTERIVSGRELILIAGRHGLTLNDVPDVCIGRVLHSIPPDEMQAALAAALGIGDAQLEILEFSSQPLPPGRLEFQRSSLNQPPPNAPETPVIWRGKLIYDERHSMAVWAKVRIAVDYPVFLATEDIKAGAVVRDTQVKAATVRGFPFSGPSVDSPAAIVGKIARRSIQAGQRFTASALDEAKDVVRGDIVQVRVIEGSATLSFDGIAASSGKKGDSILVHNSASGKNFRAVVEEKGKAVVQSTREDLE